MQERCNSSALAMDPCLSCTNPSISSNKMRTFRGLKLIWGLVTWYYNLNLYPDLSAKSSLRPKWLVIPVKRSQILTSLSKPHEYAPCWLKCHLGAIFLSKNSGFASWINKYAYSGDLQADFCYKASMRNTGCESLALSPQWHETRNQG